MGCCGWLYYTWANHIFMNKMIEEVYPSNRSICGCLLQLCVQSRNIFIEIGAICKVLANFRFSTFVRTSCQIKMRCLKPFLKGDLSYNHFKLLGNIRRIKIKRFLFTLLVVKWLHVKYSQRSPLVQGKARSNSRRASSCKVSIYSRPAHQPIAQYPTYCVSTLSSSTKLDLK